MLRELDNILGIIYSWSFSYWWIITTVVAGYLYLTCRYWHLAKQAARKIYLAPISLSGGISDQFGAHRVGLLLHVQLSAIIETFQRDRKEYASIYMVDEVGRQFRGLHGALVSAPLELGHSEVMFKEELILKIGTFQIPIGAIINLFTSVLRVLPVPFRKRYTASLIHVCLVSVGDETQLFVYQEEGQRWFSGKDSPDNKPKVGSRKSVLTQIMGVKSLTDLNTIIRDAAFMILDLQGKAFPGRNGKSMRFFADGLEDLDEFRRTGDREWLVKAEKNFSFATASDAKNYEALYFYGSLLLLQRTRKSIAQAIKVFTRGLKTEKPKLRALIHAGLANCYAQEFHRLARRETEILQKARDHAQKASDQWLQWQKEEGETADLHPWIFSTLALVQVIDEGADMAEDDVRKRFINSAGLYLQAIKREPSNGMLYNNLGWILLKLAERGIDNLTVQEGLPPELAGNPAKNAEKYLLRSLDLDPMNKLSHANLCLLYATDPFMTEREKYLDKSRYHGIKAIRLDPKYINGRRDLTISLIKYGKMDEAHKYFEAALRLAGVVEKDQEIISDIMAVLNKVQISKKERQRWLHPDPKLLEPPGTDDK